MQWRTSQRHHGIHWLHGAKNFVSGHDTMKIPSAVLNGINNSWKQRFMSCDILLAVFMLPLLSLKISTTFFFPSEIQFLEKLPENHLMVWVGLKNHLVPIPLSRARTPSNGPDCWALSNLFLNTPKDEVLGHPQLLFYSASPASL